MNKVFKNPLKKSYVEHDEIQPGDLVEIRDEFYLHTHKSKILGESVLVELRTGVRHQTREFVGALIRVLQPGESVTLTVEG